MMVKMTMTKVAVSLFSIFAFFSVQAFAGSCHGGCRGKRNSSVISSTETHACCAEMTTRPDSQSCHSSKTVCACGFVAKIDERAVLIQCDVSENLAPALMSGTVLTLVDFKSDLKKQSWIENESFHAPPVPIYIFYLKLLIS